MKDIILFRGVPGCGKTTLANKLCDYVFSADDYFEDEDGNYNFIPSEIKQAHEWCQAQVKYHMQANSTTIGVANTFTESWEMQPYFDLAREYGYMISTVVVENGHMSKDVNGVIKEVKNRMKERFQIVL